MSARKRQRIAVLGAGIMGSSVALELARRDCDVVLMDAADAPFTGASRWNEGKLHLGYLYAADPSLDTARRLLPGGLAFVDRVQALLDCDVGPAITPREDLYLVHRDSVVDPVTVQQRFAAVSDCVREQPGLGRYPGAPLSARAQALTPAELARCADTRFIRAGFRVPERSVATGWLADRFVEALRAQPRLRLAMGTRVSGVRARPSPGGEQWEVLAEPAVDGPFDAVVNALWEGRLAVDRSVGLHAAPGWSHRYRLSLFVRTRREVRGDCMVVGTGPFGDIKDYNGRDFYLSWYPAGLRAEGHDILPPDLQPLSAGDTAALVAAVREGLGRLLPVAHAILDEAASIQVQGGWVFAQGRGALSDPGATLHRRDGFGIAQRGGYLSVDTGKYSVAPWLAREVADRLVPPA